MLPASLELPQASLYLPPTLQAPPNLKFATDVLGLPVRDFENAPAPRRTRQWFLLLSLRLMSRMKDRAAQGESSGEKQTLFEGCSDVTGS